MFDIGWGEFVVIGIVALIAIGPKELPGVLRTMGQWMGKVRRMANEFQGQFQEALREAELSDLKKEVEEMQAAARGFDPMATVHQEMQSAQREMESAMNPSAPAATATAMVPLPSENLPAEIEPAPVPAVVAEPPKPGGGQGG
jgi:sec-independent protein translocase protein TatB